MSENAVRILELGAVLFTALIPVYILWVKMGRVKNVTVARDFESVIKANTLFREELRREYANLKVDNEGVLNANRKLRQELDECKKERLQMSAEFAEFRAYCKSEHK